jgi:predicted AlkP superfamily phosphohydrolase/phosphomutase
VDEGVGALLEALPADVTTVVVFALHGMGPNSSQEYFMPQLIDRLNARFFAGPAATKAGDRASQQRGLIRLLRERVPARLQNAVARAVPVAVRDAVLNRQISGGHDWYRTPGISLLADLNGYVRCMLRGRERDGMLVQDSPEAEAYLAWIRSALKELRTGHDTALVEDVLLARERFPGKRVDHLPDAIVTWTGVEPTFRIRSEALGVVTAELATGRGGNHRPDGFCVVIERGQSGESTVPPPQHIADLRRFVFAKLEQR